MFLLVRDEDVPTVASAVTAFAVEEGLETVDLATQEDGLLAALSALSGPRAIVSQSGDQVSILDLASLDIAEPEEWAEALSRACETEVIAIDTTDDGVRVHVFDSGELDEDITVTLHRSGRTRAPEALAALAEDDDGQRALEAGVVASTPDVLAQEIVRCLGASTKPGQDSAMLTFRDPLDDEESEDEAATEPSLHIDAVPGATLVGRIGGAVTSPHAGVFGVTARGVDELEGVRLELTGDALDLLRVGAIHVALRVRGAGELVHREIVRSPDDQAPIVIDLADALLEPVDAAPPVLDGADLFASMQRLMSAGDRQLLNTLMLHVSGTGRRAGEGLLTLKAAPLAAAAASSVAPGEASIAVRVTA